MRGVQGTAIATCPSPRCRPSLARQQERVQLPEEFRKVNGAALPYLRRGLVHQMPRGGGRSRETAANAPLHRFAQGHDG